MRKRIVHLLGGDNNSVIKCEEIDIAEMPVKGSVIGDFEIADIREIFVATNGEGAFHFKDPSEGCDWQRHAFFECDWQPFDKSLISSCKKSYFCLICKYIVVCQYRDYAPDYIGEVFHIPSPAELKDSYSDWLICEEDSIQVLDWSDNDRVLSEYCPAKTDKGE